LRATFPGIRNAVRVLLEVRTDQLALKFHETKDPKVRDEIYRLSRELIKLDQPWVSSPVHYEPKAFPFLLTLCTPLCTAGTLLIVILKADRVRAVSNIC
jgi:hypothetical protein